MRLLVFCGGNEGGILHDADGIAQRLAACLRHRAAHLLGQREERGLPETRGRELLGGDFAGALPAAQQPRHHFAQGENREQRDDIRDAFVKSRLVRRRRVGVSAAEAVHERVRRLVRHHIVRQATEDEPIRRRVHEVAEKQPLILLRVVSIGVRSRVRGDLELMPAEAPAYPPPESKLEPPEHTHDNRIDVLLVKARVREQLRVARGGERVFHDAVPFLVFERLPERVRRSVEIHDLHAIAPRAGLERLGGDFYPRADDPARAVLCAGVLCDNRQLLSPWFG